jgi:hypothetical protein
MISREDLNTLKDFLSRFNDHEYKIFIDDANITSENYYKRENDRINTERSKALSILYDLEVMIETNEKENG